MSFPESSQPEGKELEGAGRGVVVGGQSSRRIRERAVSSPGRGLRLGVTGAQGLRRSGVVGGGGKQTGGGGRGTPDGEA